MKKFLLSVSLLMLLVSGCAHNPIPQADARVKLVGGLGSSVYVSDVLCVRNQAGYCLLQANMVNNSKKQARVEYKVQWLDGTGMEIESLVSTWQMIAVQPGEIKGLSAVAPNKEASDFRFYARPFGR